MIPLAQAAGVAPWQQQGKGGSPNGAGSYNTGSTGRLAPLSAAPLPPLPALAFTADSASAGTPDATPTSLPPAAPAQQEQKQQQAMGGAAARRNKRKARPAATAAAQQAAACDSDDWQGSHGSGTAGGTHRFHWELPPASAAAAGGRQAPPGAFAYANAFGAAAGLPGAGAAGSSPAGPAALPLDLSGLDDLDGELPALLFGCLLIPKLACRCVQPACRSAACLHVLS
jgi:hypothetical protein